MSWISSATGIHLSGKPHQRLFDAKRLGTNIAEAASAVTGNPELIPLIEGASQKYGTQGNILNDATAAYAGYKGMQGGGGGGAGATSKLQQWEQYLKPLLTGAVSAAGGGSGSNGLLKLGAAGEGIYNTLQADKYRGKAIDAASQNYADRGQFRTMGANMMQGAQTPPNFTSQFANRANPFARPGGAPGLPMGALPIPTAGNPAQPGRPGANPMNPNMLRPIY